VPLPPDLSAEVRAARETCTRTLGWRPTTDARAALQALLDATPEGTRTDMYGDGGVVADLETEVAAALGMEAAVFFPSGTMAQQVVLRIHADRRGSRTVAYHPTAHVEIHEEHGYAHLHGLVAKPVGDSRAPLQLADLEDVHEPLAALLLELPQREIGGPLPEWDELVAQTTWAREHGAAVHLDGARLWEAAPYYDRRPAEVAALFDTVYVSFYKGLAGWAGAALAGPADVLAEARVWRRRHGGTLVSLWPYALSALVGLRSRLAGMPAGLALARRLAEAVRGLDGVEVVVDPPQTALVHLRLRQTDEGLARAALALAQERGWAVPFRCGPSESPRWVVSEVMLDGSGDDWTAEELREIYARLVAP
jgi:threonine aldolase